MLVRQSLYDAMELRALRAEKNSDLYQLEYFKLKNQWNDLVSQVNAKGGRQFLNEGSVNADGQAFTADEIDRLIRLCHPDKHNQSTASNEMTKKLLQLRKETA